MPLNSIISFNEICITTLNDVDSNGDGKVQFEEYAEYARHHPELLRAFTVNIQEIIGDGREIFFDCVIETFCIKVKTLCPPRRWWKFFNKKK